MNERGSTRWWKLSSILALLAILAAGTVFALVRNQARAAGVSGAAFTTVNTNVDGTGHCLNGSGAVNCNIYDAKTSVWLTGGPSTAALGNGTYFFAVLDPSGQPNPNDGSGGNLSSP
ncbi:MAG: hypothetical protein KGO05_00180, partial [Chloroflexota bacterium]|nr:hypothetical protein [Chloroflexota bacterium]